MKIIDINGNERDCERVEPDLNFPGQMLVTFKSKNRPGYEHKEWYDVETFIANNPELVGLTKGVEEEPESVSGMVKNSTKTTLVSTISIDPEIYVDYPVWISRGKGEGQVRNIIKNSTTTIYIDKPWDILPDETSQFVLSKDIPETNPKGNVATK